MPRGVETHNGGHRAARENSDSLAPALGSGMGLGNVYFSQAAHVILKQRVPTLGNTVVGKQVSASWSEKVWAPSCPEAGI